MAWWGGLVNRKGEKGEGGGVYSHHPVLFVA